MGKKREVDTRASNARVEFPAGGPPGADDTVSEYSALDELDEETISWGVLVTRVVSIFLLVCIIIAVSVGAVYSNRLMILAGVISVVLIIVFALSFVDMERCRSKYSWHGRFDPTGALISAGWRDKTPSTSSQL